MKILPVGSELFHADRRADARTNGRTDGRTDGQTGMMNLIVAFLKFAIMPKRTIRR